MSQVIICIYDKANLLSDSITVDASIEAVVNVVTSMDTTVRTNALGNILSVHVDHDNATTLAFAARLREVLTGENVERVVEVWCALTGTVADNWRIARVNGNGLTVNMNTLGGWSNFNVADTRNKTEMADLKQWVLEKAGLMADQRTDSSRAIHPSHLRNAGLNFLGHVTSLSELENSWPVEAFQPGSAWLDPTHLYVCVRVGEKLRSYLRSEVGAPERVKSLITEAVPPMPEKAKGATRWMDLDTWMADSRAQGINIDLLGMQLRELCYVDGEDLPQHHGILRLAEVVIEADPTRTGGFNVWVDGEGYPATGHDGLTNGQLLEIDARINDRLSLTELPTDLFQCIYSFSSDNAVNYAREHLTHRAILVVTQYELVFVDTAQDALVIDRNHAMAEEVYVALLRRYPMMASSIAASTFSKMYPELMNYSITTTGPMQESLSIRNTSTEQAVSFLLSDWAGITAWAAMLTDTTGNETAATERGMLKSFLVADELGTLPEAVPASTAENELEAARALVQQTTGSITNALDGLRSRRGAVAHPESESGTQPGANISVPVVDDKGNTLYRMNFHFDNALARDAAVDVGFAAQLAAKLGQPNFRGVYTLCSRIAELGPLAEELFLATGLSGTFGYSRS